MVSRDIAWKLMRTTYSLSYVYERCRSSFELTPNQNIQVKGKGFILDSIQREYDTIDTLLEISPNLTEIKDKMRYWIKYLNRRYSGTLRIFGSKFYISNDDARALKKDVETWIQGLLSTYENRGTYMLHGTIEDIIPKDLSENMNENTQQDLIDAYLCNIHLFPTPAAMMSLRVAENIARSLYEKMTEKPSETKNWNKIITELETNEKLPVQFLKYLNYLKDIKYKERNHNKRYSQEESEKLLFHIKGLLTEYNKLK